MASAACAVACREGVCVDCNDGERRCSDGAVQICQNGSWETDQVCPVTCEDGTCVASCTLDRLQCDGPVRLQRCDGTSYVDEEMCEFVCLEQACTGECKPDARRCNPAAPTEVQSCNSLGEWADSQPCPAESFCVQGECKPCDPDSKRCTETGPQACSGEGQWVPLGACGSELPACHEGTCVSCEPGDKRCADNALEVCSADGSVWEILERCGGTTPACLESTKACGSCSVGDTQCNSDTVQTCDETGGWVDLMDCTGAASQCLDGTCVACNPAENQRRCPDQNTAQACASDGSWGATSECIGDTPLCREDLAFSCGCEEDGRRCADNRPEVCTGGAWVPQASCTGTTPYCLPSTGRCEACEPDDEQCQSGVAYRCSSSGSWVSLQACSGTHVNCGDCDLGEACESPADCSSGYCVSDTCTECSPGDEDCTGTTPTICSAQGKWDNQDPCPAPADGNATCSDGTCGFSCRSGFRTCEDRCIQNSACCTDSDCPVSASCSNDMCVCHSGFTGPNCVPIFEPIARISTQDGACEARAISGDGSIIAGFCADSSGTSVAFRWVSGVVSPLADTGTGSEAYGISSNGTIVVGMAGNLPAKWTNGTLSMHLTLGTAEYPGEGYISDVSANGSRLAGYSNDPTNPWYWVHWGSSTSAPPTAFWHWAALDTFEAMADDGDLLVGSSYDSNEGQYRASYFQISTGFTSWLWSTGSDKDNFAYGVSSNGTAIVGESHLIQEPTVDRQAIVWRGLAGTLPDELGVAGRANVANANGSVIGGIGAVSGSSNAVFLWRSGGVVGLQSAITSRGAATSGWTLTEITGLSADGAIVTGYGTNPDGDVQGWRVTLTGTDVLEF